MLDIRETFADGPDMFHVTSTPVLKRDHDMLCSHLSLGFTHDGELYKVRTKPHLYDDWHVEMVTEHRAQFLTDLEERYPNVLDWDCHKCKHAVITQGIGPCPNCGG